MRIVTKEAFDLSGKQNYPSDPAPIPLFPRKQFFDQRLSCCKYNLDVSLTKSVL